MNQLNSVLIEGDLHSRVQLKKSNESGDLIGVFTLRSKRETVDPYSRDKKEHFSFFRCSVSGKTAELLAEKEIGTVIQVIGSLFQEYFEDSTNHITIVCEYIEFYPKRRAVEKKEINVT